MGHFKSEDIAVWSKGEWKDAAIPASITGFCFDARQIKPGECFVALSCGVRDGHEFVRQALENGAGALLVERFQEIPLPQLKVDDSLLAMDRIAQEVRRRFTGPVVGVTGSCGKTSTKEMLRVLLEEAHTHATPGNWNNRIGVPMTLFGLDTLQHDFAVIEAGINQPGEMSFLGSMIEADLTLVTNIGPVHLELLGSRENVATEKSFLVTRSKANAPLVLPESAFEYPAFSNCADRAYVVTARETPLSPKPAGSIHYSLEISGTGYSKLLLGKGSTAQTFEIASPSKGICMNAALAIVAARLLGVTDEAIAERLRAWTPGVKRGRIMEYNDCTFYTDCYNANPASMSDALAAFDCSVPSDQPRCYLLGTMNELGEDSEQMHRAIGKLLRLNPHDTVFFIGPDSQTRAYFEGAVEGGADPKQLSTFASAEMMQSMIADFSGSLFLKGSRSHQLEKILPEQVLVATP